VIEKGNKVYLANTLVLKMKADQRNSGIKELLPSAAIEKILLKEGMVSSEYLFDYSEEKHELAQIVKIIYSSNEDPVYLSKKISALNDVEWCEPHFLRKIDFVPNDPSYSTQYSLPRIQAAEAWDITQGILL
jgi:hypothetical protein